ncbi:MAG: hypothetical protein IJZ86_04710 [Bacteroides sp.]|nr:hypothetical protein [Bacteroides sp.]
MQVKWGKRALRRLDGAVDYGLRQFGKITSERLYRKMRSYDVLLSLNPQVGKVELLLAGRRYEYRSLVVPNTTSWSTTSTRPRTEL